MVLKIIIGIHMVIRLCMSVYREYKKDIAGATYDLVWAVLACMLVLALEIM